MSAASAPLPLPTCRTRSPRAAGRPASGIHELLFGSSWGKGLDAGIAKAENKLQTDREEALVMLRATSQLFHEFDQLLLTEIEKCAELAPRS